MNHQIKKSNACLTDGIYVLDHHWCCIHVNDRLCEIVGLPREAMLDRSQWELFPETLDTEIETQLRRARDEQVAVQFAYYHPVWDCWLEYWIHPSEQQIVIFTSEISERKLAKVLLNEREQLQRLLEAERSARLEAERANQLKDHFLAILSHELRSPLNPILGWSSLMQSRNFDTTRTSEALAIIERNAKLQVRLIDDLLDVSRILRGKLNLEAAPVDLVQVVKAAIETVRTAAVAKSISLEPVLQEVGWIEGDATRLQQIAWNLLSNAIKFTPKDGRVEIRLEQVGREAQLTISDTGKGIDSDFLPYLFASFRQEDSSTTRKYGGLGLGLAIAQYLVEAHSGTISATSAGEGQGATFTVRLPLIDAELEPRQPDERQSSSKLDLTNIRVLAVDDDPATRSLLDVMLSQYGAEVLIVGSASEALSAIAAFQPDILISDIVMTGINGYALIQQVRQQPTEQGGQTPAIALTASARQEDQQCALAAGFQQHIPKPIEPSVLVQAILDLSQQSISHRIHLWR